MKSTLIAILAGLAARASAHATFQILYVDGVNYITQCARLPGSNSPVTDVLSNDIACNAGSSSAAAKCAVKAGSTVTVEMHQQPNTKDCASEAIGGAHYGPVQVYLAKVSDASSAVGSSAGWFKIFADTWAKSAGASGDDDYWGTKDLTTCCGRMNIKIPSDIAPGDYLLRAEALALHTAGSSGGAQFYMTCYQITVTGGGSASPATVKLPGAYAAADPGILVDIHAKMSTYIAPGPTVYSGGSTKSAGAACGSCESTCAATQASGTAVRPSTTAAPTTLSTSTAPGATTSASSGGGANCVAKYAQCGGQGWTGATCCQSGSTCSATNQYYSQCL